MAMHKYCEMMAKFENQEEKVNTENEKAGGE